MVNKYELGPQRIAATIEYNNDTDQVKVKFYVNGEQFAFLMSQGNLARLLHRKGEFIEGLIIDN
jgi:hypothetical protein